MKRWITYLAWAWEIIIGGLLITPGGVFCIACGTVSQAPGYIGEVAIKVIGVVAIILGVYGFATAGGGQSAAGGA